MVKSNRMLTLSQLGKEYGLPRQVMKNKMVAAAIIDPETHLPFQLVIDAGGATVHFTDKPTYGTEPVNYARYLLSYIEAKIPGPSAEERAARCKDIFDAEVKLLSLVAGLSKPLGLHRYVSQGIENSNMAKRLAEVGLGKADFDLMRQCYERSEDVFGSEEWHAAGRPVEQWTQAAGHFMDKTARIRAAAAGHEDADFSTRVMELLVLSGTAVAVH